MEISITQFRQNLFEFVTKAMSGSEVWVTHRGRRFRIVPESLPASRLSRVTPLEVINPAISASSPSLREEMERAWEQDWAEL
jgi:prevent-host-death family protein